MSWVSRTISSYRGTSACSDLQGHLYLHTHNTHIHTHPRAHTHCAGSLLSLRAVFGHRARASPARPAPSSRAERTIRGPARRGAGRRGREGAAAEAFLKDTGSWIRKGIPGGQYIYDEETGKISVKKQRYRKSTSVSHKSICSFLRC